MKTIAVIGSSGAIGRATLDCISAGGDYKIVGLCAGKSADAVLEQARKFDCQTVGLADDKAAARAQKQGGGKLKVAAGANSVNQIIAETSPDAVMLASSSGDALLTAAFALERGCALFMASKEPMAQAADLLLKLAGKSGAKRLIPIDSELTALWFLTSKLGKKSVDRLLITASGGPFWGKSFEYFADASASEALAHPRWKMGEKITIDSATLVNKTLEVVVASRLFGFEHGGIDVAIHPQAKVHAGITTRDGATAFMASEPDMRAAIRKALSSLTGCRASSKVPPMNLYESGLEFKKPDGWAADMLAVAPVLIKSRRAAVNFCAMDEAAVAEYLSGGISLADVYRLVMQAAAEDASCPEPETIEEIEKTRVEAAEKYKKDLKTLIKKRNYVRFAP